MFLYVQNITDVGHLLDTGEDRILRKARQAAAKPMQIVESYTHSYLQDMDNLKVLRPDIMPRASAHIPEQIAMIQTLLTRGHAYEADGNVYFDVRSFEGYGKLSNRRVEEQESGSRESVRTDKRHPDDFALWKVAEPEHILRWPSPWGEGFPGWHIECSAMARKYLGDTFDIHGGGIDNIFPHNECEIAQSEACTGVDFARYWLLVGSLMVPDRFGNPVKMSKSLGNFVTIKDALDKYRPEVIRAFVASGHYRNPITFGDSGLSDAATAWERMYTAVHFVREKIAFAPDTQEGNAILETIESTRQAFTAAMDDDFNAPVALAALYGLTREVNDLVYRNPNAGKSVLQEIDKAYRELGGGVLGIVPAQTVDYNPQRESDLIRFLVDMRRQARQDRNFDLADRIRDELQARGVAIVDPSNDETFWYV